MEFNVEPVNADGKIPEPQRKVGPGQTRRPSPFDAVVATAIANGDTGWKSQSYADEAEKDLVVKELNRAVKYCGCSWEECSNPEEYPGRLVFFVRPRRVTAPRKPRTPRVAKNTESVATSAEAPTVPAAPPHPHQPAYPHSQPQPTAVAV